MNKHLDEAISRVRRLPDDQQQEAAALLLDFLANSQSDVYLTPEQIAEIERRMADEQIYATDEEVRAFFDRLTR